MRLTELDGLETSTLGATAERYAGVSVGRPALVKSVPAFDPGQRQIHGLGLALLRSHQRRSIVFQTNVGGIDRVLRISVGLVLIALVFVGPKTPWGWVGVIPLATGFLRTCPLYSLLGISSCPRQ